MSNAFKQICEFIKSEEFTTAFEQFKASKEPKKEWEIVAYRYLNGPIDKCIHTNNGSVGWDEASAGDANYVIHSVRRLSDGLALSVGEKFLSGAGRTEVVTSFEINGKNIWVHFESGSNNLQYIKKLPTALFTTLDGKDIISGDVFWVVNKETQLSERLAGISSPNYIFDGDKVFSTREAAETYILENRALLSIKDLRELLIHCVGLDLTNEIVGFATNLVKSKLNP